MRKYLTWGYLIIICTILPLYMKEGYYRLGESKGTLYLIISLAFALLLILFENKKLFAGASCEGYVFFSAAAFLFQMCSASYLLLIKKFLSLALRAGGMVFLLYS